MVSNFWGQWHSSEQMAIEALANMVVGNLSLGILIRQQNIINLLFWLATRAPRSWPLAIRQRLAKVYHLGGIHSGSAVAATVWFALLTGAMTFNLAHGYTSTSIATAVVTYMLLTLLLLVVLMALPRIRSNFHNNFERTHRFAGWTALLLFWLQTVLLINDLRGPIPMTAALLSSFGFWMLIAITVCIAWPWLFLKKVSIKVDTPSPHVALVQLNYGVSAFPGSTTTISRNPLLEWHPFANIPTPGKNGFRLAISRAGDWTRAFIEEKPSTLR